MLDSGPNLSASRWAPQNRGRPSAYLANPLQPQLPPSPNGGADFRQSSPTRTNGPASIRRSPTRAQNLTPAQQRRYALSLYSRLFSRLKWRASLLLTAHTFALSPDSHGIGLSQADAGTQFRIDFFEFYVLLERTLLHLLNAVGVRVSATYNPANDSSKPPSDSLTSSSHEHPPVQGLLYSKSDPPMTHPTSTSIIGDSRALVHKHAFHQNLLTALSTSLSNPLYPFLGTGQVYQYIALAKDLRNGWKDSSTSHTTATSTTNSQLPHTHSPADETAEQQRLLQERLSRRYADLLKDLQIDEMLRVVLSAVEAAGGVAEQEVEAFAAKEAAQEFAGRRVSVDMTDVAAGAEKPWESMGLGAGWEGDEMEFD